MIVSEMIVLYKKRFLQLHHSRVTPDKPKSSVYIKRLQLYAEQLNSGTAHSVPGEKGRTLHAVMPRLLFETKRGLFFFVVLKDKVVKMPSSMKRSVPEQKWVMP